jgi:hypothetical protein
MYTSHSGRDLRMLVCLLLTIIALGGAVNRAAGEANANNGSGCVPQWVRTFGGATGVNGIVNSMAVWDDGSGDGPTLYIGGNFTIMGGAFINSIAKWNPKTSTWSPLGTGIEGDVLDMTV